ncbi:RHS repeat-associated core domain-containing protein [Pseudomonas sp. Tri1]|uniref:RHS repeat-associated core domain-containing protein n=1 Tax=Pseudomonas sp. Tri1 TaxID=2823875 RepID=UPI001B31E88A|nr:RHS repeat-associated core domain-containing protein [Pseudomonas sp. Tri1]
MPDAPRGTVLCRYRYDPLDRLVDCAPSAEAGIQRFYCKSRLATEIQGAVQRSVFQHDDQLLAQLRCEDVKIDTTLLATDQQRSVLNVLDANRLHPLVYTPYGHRPAENGLLSLLGFNGERPDPVTRHYLLGNGYRAFNPVLMRFNSPDSWSPFGGGGLNAYVYCGGDPRNRTDPSGHIWGIGKFFRRVSNLRPKALKSTQSTQLLIAKRPSLSSISIPEQYSPIPPISVPEKRSPPPPISVPDQQSPAPPIPPKNASKPLRPVTKPKPLPTNFTIINKKVFITLPNAPDHVFVAPYPLDNKSISALRKEGVHIHPSLLSTPRDNSRFKQGFDPGPEIADLRQTP